MKNIEILKQNDFHDSLLEKISYDEKNQRVTLEIDFCNWRQSWYHEKEPETKIIVLVFELVSDIVIPEFCLDSDGIIEFNFLQNEESTTGVEIVVFNEAENAEHSIVIYANEVNVIWDTRDV
ncbi:MAG: hypothetical protein E7397_04685 [Ruminococcaceae bacterium]|nr:hypothetical protein [Oscillospiraceae bacterium]